jgi:hypothetical protein
VQSLSAAARYWKNAFFLELWTSISDVNWRPTRNLAPSLPMSRYFMSVSRDKA